MKKQIIHLAKMAGFDIRYSGKDRIFFLAESYKPIEMNFDIVSLLHETILSFGATYLYN